MKINWSNLKKIGRFIWFMIFVLLAVAIVFSILYDPGYALFVYDRWSVEMPLWILAISLGIFYILCRGIAYVFKIPSRLLLWIRKHHEKKGIKYFNHAMYALIQGELHNAQKEFLLSCKYLTDPLLAYVQTIKIATIQHDISTAQTHLDKIKALLSAEFTAKPHNKTNSIKQLVLHITEATVLIECQQYQAALAILQHAQHEFPQQPQIIYLLHRVYLEQKNWTVLWRMLPQLQELEYFSPEALFQLEQTIYQGLIIDTTYNRSPDETQLWHIWEHIPRNNRKDPDLLVAFARALLAFNRHDDAEVYVHNYLKKNWDDRLIYFYGLIHADDWQKQLAFAEQWLLQYPHNAALLTTMGRLSERNKIYGKARSYYEEALATKPCREICWLLAELAEKLNDSNTALTWYRKAATMTDDSVC